MFKTKTSVKQGGYMLELQNIQYKRDGKHILNNVSLSIQPHKLVAITRTKWFWKIYFSQNHYGDFEAR